VRYQVRFSIKAEQDVAAVLSWHYERVAVASGERWLAQLMARIAALETHPERCALAAEAKNIGVEVRELLLGTRRNTHRILFQISGPVVDILRIRHTARDVLSRGDLK
jgi:plasmid stabilization system protein ParE